MNEQIAQWREEFEAAYGDEHTPTDSFGNYIYYHQDLQFRGYVIARTEQATERAELLPLAKFGAMVFKAPSFENMLEIYRKSGLLDANDNLMPNIEATITKLLKD
jgi:hypothetical protein